MRQHPFYGFPVQEFGTPKSTFFFKVKCAIFGPKLFFFCPKWVVFGQTFVFLVPNVFFLVQNAFFYENVENVSIPDSDRGRFFTPLRVRDLTKNLSLNSKHTIFEEKRIYK